MLEGLKKQRDVIKSKQCEFSNNGAVESDHFENVESVPEQALVDHSEIWNL